MRQSNKAMVYFDRIIDAGRMAGIFMVFLSMMGLSTHVVLRYLFDYPLNWVVDVSTIFIVLITFLGTPWLLREEGHVALDILKSYVSPESWRKLQIFNSILCVVICLVITVFGIREVIKLHQMDLYLDMPLAPPKAPIMAVVPLGTLLLSVQFGRRAFKLIRKSGGHHHGDGAKGTKDGHHQKSS